MDMTVFQDLAMQSVEMLRRAAERSTRNVRPFQPDQGGRVRVEVLRTFLVDSQADLASLQFLRKTADELLQQGMEAEQFCHFCQIALEAAQITLKGIREAESSQQSAAVSNDENGTDVLALFKRHAEEVEASHAYFRRLADWLQTPPPPLPPAVLEQLTKIPVVNGSRAAS